MWGTLGIRVPVGNRHGCPHAPCGERSEPILPEYTIAGSSPRMWGTPGRQFHGSLRIGSDPHGMWGTSTEPVHLVGRPAHVGNAAGNMISGMFLFRFHPHAWGTLGHAPRTRYFPSGSSPRMWGTQPKEIQIPMCLISVLPRMWGTPSPLPVDRKCVAPVSCPCCGVFSAPHPHACGETQKTVA